MSLKEETTDGKTGMENADTSINENYPKSKHGYYDHAPPGTTSLDNEKTELENGEVVDEYEFVDEKNQNKIIGKPTF